MLGAAGLDVGGESIPHVAGWGEDGALDAIRAYDAAGAERWSLVLRTREAYASHVGA